MASLYEMLFGSAPTIKKESNLSDQQEQILNQLLQNVGQQAPMGFNYLQSILGNDPQSMNQFFAPQMRSFQEETIPSILERFSGSGARSSSGLNQTLARAGERLQESLGAQRANLQGNAAQSLFSLLGQGLQPYQQSYVQQGQTGLLPALAPAVGAGLGSIGGPIGTALGTSLGSLIEKYFSGKKDVQNQQNPLQPSLTT